MQLRELHSFAQYRGFKIVHEYVENGISGASTERPQLSAMLAAARRHASNRPFDAILVWRFDRFARSTRFLLSSLEEFRTLNMQFISCRENIDTTTPIGNMMFTLIAAMSQFERDCLRERTCAGLRNARAKGHRLGRVPVPVDIPRLQALRASGLTLMEISHRLNIGYGTVRKHLNPPSVL